MPMAYSVDHDGTVSILPPPMQILFLTEGAVIQAALTLATSLGIADLLAKGPQTSDALAQATSTHLPSLYRVLRLLSSFGVFAEVAPGRFAQTASSELLRTGTVASLRSFVQMTGLPVWAQTYAEALHSVKTGEPAWKQVVGAEVFEYLATHPAESAVVNAAMSDFGRGVSEAVVQAYDFSGLETIVDVGGGHGTLLSAILRRHTHLKGVLFDLPHVVDGARALIASAGLADRCEIRGGDFFTEVPVGGDAYILSFVIHDWDRGRAVAILKRCRQVMSTTGRLLLVEAVIPPGNEPHFGKILDFVMLTAAGGQERTQEEYRGLLQEAGFRLNTVVTTASPLSVIEGRPC